MNVSSENPYTSSFRASGVAFVLILAASLSLIVSPLLVLATLGAAVFLWTIVRRPTTVLGIVLAFMPLDFMAIALGKFFNLPHMTLVSLCTKEIPLFLLAVVLLRRNGFRPTSPDWWLLGSFFIACARTLFGGTWVALWTDFNFVLPYFIGRMTILSEVQERAWAKCAVWIAATLSILGLVEVFIIGDGPRTLLYLALDTGGTQGGKLTASFSGEGFTGLREAATMVGPNSFGVLCMLALILWWIYLRNPLPAGMVATGLICCVTRADWIGTAASISVLAVIMGQRKRFLRYAVLALILFVMSIPLLGLGDYLFLSKAGQDLSTEYHQERIVEGLKYAIDHPFGGGNTKLSPVAIVEDSNITVFETTYPYFAAAYGAAAALTFIGFLFSALHCLWRRHDQLSYAAIGMIIGISVVMVFTLPLNDRRLAYWAFFPIGLAVRPCISALKSEASTPQDIEIL